MIDICRWIQIQKVKHPKRVKFCNRSKNNDCVVGLCNDWCAVFVPKQKMMLQKIVGGISKEIEHPLDCGIEGEETAVELNFGETVEILCERVDKKRKKKSRWVTRIIPKTGNTTEIFVETDILDKMTGNYTHTDNKSRVVYSYKRRTVFVYDSNNDLTGMILPVIRCC